MTSHDENSGYDISNLNRDFDFDIAKTVFKKNWVWIIIMILVGFMASYIYLRYTKPIYESKAIIQKSTKDEGRRILEFDNFIPDNNLSADVELLKSNFLLEKALINLNLKVSYFSEGEFLIQENFTESPYHITFFELKDSSLINLPIYVVANNGRIAFVFDHHGQKQTIDFEPDSVIDNNYFKLTFKIDDDDEFYNSIDSDQLFFKINDYKNLTASLNRNLFVKIVNPEASTIEIAFRSNNKTLAKDLVNEIIHTFFNYDLEQKSQSEANILKFIDEQLDTVYSNLKYSENDLQLFKSQSKNNNPEIYKSNVISQIEKLRSQELDADYEYELISGINKGITSRNRIDIYKLIPIVTGTKFQQLLEGQLDKLHQLLEQKEDASYKLSSENETLKKLETSIDNQIETIERTLVSIKSQVKSRKEGISQKINILESQLYGVPEKEMKLASLNRNFDLNEKYYSLLIEKRTQYEISKAGYKIDNLVLYEPSVARLIFPNKKFIYLGVLIISFLIGLIIIAIKYLLFNSIHSEKELRKLLPSRIGFLGIIPKVKMTEDNSILLIHKKPKSVLSENYRHIRTNLQFILDQNKSNVIAISSSVSGEGKTFVSLNLAGIYTMADKRVIVLDLDLRRPKIHLGFNAENKIGMSSILAEKANWKDCIQNSEIEGLDFITAGTIPPNPSELILNGKLDQVIEELKTIYDIVIIDNPPVGIVSDGVKVMNDSDCPIYVFRANYSKRKVVHQVSKLLNEDKVKDLYIILNDVEFNSGSYGYGYGYYGSYYTDVEEKRKFNWKIWKS